jgi:hypothetical protein
MDIPTHSYGKLTTEHCKWSGEVLDQYAVIYWKKKIQLSSNNAQLYHFIRLMVVKKPPFTLPYHTKSEFHNMQCDGVINE